MKPPTRRPSVAPSWQACVRPQAPPRRPAPAGHRVPEVRRRHQGHRRGGPGADGGTLRLNLFRPATGGPFPVILSAHPYGNEVPHRSVAAAGR